MKNKILSNRENISFYTSEIYDPKLDINADIVIIKSDFKSAKKKISSWKKNGYSTHYCVNISWGDFSEYLNGKWDDINHWDEVQTDKFGKYIFHGPNIPFMVPTVSFNNYILTKITPILETGIDAIHIEEPYFFVKSGYSKAFKKEWEMYFKSPYISPHKDVNSQYLSSILKGKLIYRSIAFLSTAIKSYVKYHMDKDIKIYVQTRGYLSNIHNKTITPIKKITESKYIDGIVVDSDTINQRTDLDNSERDIKLFESTFIEFNSMKECMRYDSKEIWFSFDFLSKNILSSWEKHKKDYLAKLSAALLISSVDKYIICDEPKRIYNYSSKPIPTDYLMTVQNCTNFLAKKPYHKEIWEGTDDNPIGIFISDTIMYQQEYPSDDIYGNINRNDINNFNNFYGLAHPFFSGGQKINMIPIEHVISDSRYLNNYNVMILSYDFMKPIKPSIHYAINEWVRSGGVLVVAGTNNDSFNNINEWWNTSPNSYKYPMQHLFELLEVSEKTEALIDKINKTNRFNKILTEGITSVGDGIFAYFPERPAKCITDPKYSKYLKDLVFTAVEKKKIKFISKAHYSLKRGAYRIISDISNGRTKYENTGTYCDITSSCLCLKNNISLQEYPFLLVYDIDGKPDDDFEIISATGKVYNLAVNETEISFNLKPMIDVPGYIRIYFQYPCIITINDVEVLPEKENIDSKTILLRFEPTEKILTVKVRRKRI